MKELYCTNCIHCEIIYSIKPLIYCRWFGEPGQDAKAIECVEYVDREVLKND